MKHKTVYVGFGFSLLSLIIMRVCQLLFTIESNTGFYKSSYSNFSVLCLVVIALFVTAMMYFSFTDINPDNKGKEGKICATFSALTGGALLAKAVFLVMKQLGNFEIVVAATAVMATIAYVGYAQSVFTDTPQKPLFHILTVPFWLVELIYVFVENNDISAVPERIYDIVTVGLCVVFSLYHLKFKADMLNPFGKKLMVALGLVTAAFCFVSTLPRYIVILLGGGEQLHASAISDALFPMYGAMIISFVFGVFKTEKNK